MSPEAENPVRRLSYRLRRDACVRLCSSPVSGSDGFTDVVKEKANRRPQGKVESP